MPYAQSYKYYQLSESELYQGKFQVTNISSVVKGCNIVLIDIPDDQFERPRLGLVHCHWLDSSHFYLSEFFTNKQWLSVFGIILDWLNI